MTGAEIMAVVAFFLMVSGVLWGIWWKIDAQVKERVKSLRDDTADKIDATAALAALARSELAEHKLHVAERYVSKEGMREQTAQLMEAISGVKAAVDGMTMRIDRVVENQPKPTTRRSS